MTPPEQAKAQLCSTANSAAGACMQVDDNHYCCSSGTPVAGTAPELPPDALALPPSALAAFDSCAVACGSGNAAFACGSSLAGAAPTPKCMTPPSAAKAQLCSTANSAAGACMQVDNNHYCCSSGTPVAGTAPSADSCAVACGSGNAAFAC